jgi:ribosomal-protein-alanine N-acetyltransferase
MAKSGKKVVPSIVAEPFPVRWMIRRDMPEVLRIESNSSDNPWLEDDFLTALRQRNCIGMVAEQDSRVVGFMIYDLDKVRLQLLRLGVAPSWRREKVGTSLITKLKNKLSQQRRQEVVFILRERDTEGQLFLRASGFKAAAVIRDHFTHTHDDGYTYEDGYRMVFSLPPDGVSEDGVVRTVCPHCGHRLNDENG